jgi:hypothetical protein
MGRVASEKNMGATEGQAELSERYATASGASGRSWYFWQLYLAFFV